MNYFYIDFWCCSCHFWSSTAHCGFVHGTDLVKFPVFVILILNSLYSCYNHVFEPQGKTIKL